MPPRWKQMINFEYLRAVTFRERLKLLLGYRLRIKVAVVCEHSPGKFEPKMAITVTPQTDPKEPQV